MLLKITFIIALSLAPCLLSLILLGKAKRRWQARLARVRSSVAYGNYYQEPLISIATQTESSQPSCIGDITCKYNARSPHLRCAINPAGPCENCPYYEARTL